LKFLADFYDQAQEAPPATPEDRTAILNLLSQYVSTNKVLVFDSEKHRGQYTPKKKMQSEGKDPAR